MHVQYDTRGKGTLVRSRPFCAFLSVGSAGSQTRSTDRYWPLTGAEGTERWRLFDGSSQTSNDGIETDFESFRQAM
jgi:hypothetical protein